MYYTPGYINQLRAKVQLDRVVGPAVAALFQINDKEETDRQTPPYFIILQQCSSLATAAAVL